MSSSYEKLTNDEYIDEDVDAPGPSSASADNNGRMPCTSLTAGLANHKNCKMQSIVEELDNELQKEQQGIFTDDALDRLLYKIEYSMPGAVFFYFRICFY